MNTKLLRRLSGAALLAGLVLLSACRTSVNTVGRAQPEGQRQMVADKRILTDANLSREVAVVGVNQAMTPGGVIQVQVEVLNRTRSAKNFNYRFEWFDGAGMQITPAATSMASRRIESGESLFLSSIAPTAACKDFRLKLIEGD